MKYAFALAAIAGVAAAQPHAGHAKFHKRDVQTVTDWTVVTVTDIVTVYGPSPAPSSVADVPSSAPAAADPSSAPAAVSDPAPVSSAAASPAPVDPAPADPSTAVAIATPAQSPTPVAAPQDPPVQSSSAAAAAPPTQSSAAPAPPSGGDSSVGHYGVQPGANVAADCSKDAPCKEGMTAYTTGIGACGYDDTTNNDMVVALQMDMFGSVSNKGLNMPSNPLCDKRIQITNPATGATAVGVIRDRCMGCTGSGGIDLSLPLWAKLNSGPPDRLPVEWYFLD